MATNFGDVPVTTDLETFRHKSSVWSSATSLGIVDLDNYDSYHVTAANATVAVPNPLHGASGDNLFIRLRDDGTNRSISWDTQYRGQSGGSALPSSTTTGKTLYCWLRCNSNETKWDLMLTNLY